MRSLNVHNKDMDNRCLTIVGHKHYKMLYIWVMIQLFLCPREGALKKKTSGICQNAGLTTTHFKPFLNVKILREVFMSYNGQTTVVHVI
jgi:hypothetical protein